MLRGRPEWRIGHTTMTLFIVLAGIHVIAPPTSYFVPIGGATAVAVLCARRAARTPAGLTRQGWRMVAAAMGLNAVADVVYEALQYFHDEVPGLSIADVFYLLSYPALFVGVIAIVRGGRGLLNRDVVIDALTVATVGGLAIWQIAIVNSGLADTDQLLERVVFSTYPLADTLIIAAVVGILLTPGRGTDVEVGLGGFLAVLLGADLLYTWMEATGAYWIEAGSDAAFTLAYGALAATAITMDTDAVPEPAHRSSSTHRARLVLLGAATVGPSVLAIVSASSGSDISWPIYVVIMGAVAAIVMSRMATLIGSLEHEQLELQASQAALRYEATHDPLTGLPNRAQLLAEVDAEIIQRRGTVHRLDGRRLALLFLDLDQFKVVNDSLGHRAGDELLVAMGQRLLASVSPGDLVARLGGDEFVIACRSAGSTAEIAETARRLLEDVVGPVALSDGLTFARASIGIAICTGHSDAIELLRDADIALYRAKALGGRRIELFDASMRRWATERHQIETRLRTALMDKRDLRVVYQPKVCVATGAMLGVEALARWHDPQRGDISPDQFIPVAETSGLIDELGAWVLEQACTDLAELHRRHPDSPPLGLAVNVSARQLAHRSLVTEVAAILDRSRLDPRLLTLELTETCLADEPDVAANTLLELRGLHLKIDIDDFGTGYSSLAYLSQFAIDGLKIDRRFIQQLGTGHTAHTVVKAILALAEALHLHVTAEGVETEAQADQLRTLGCHTAQGFYYAPALELATLQELTAALVAADQPIGTSQSSERDASQPVGTNT